jgi:hypothetical protein
LQSNLSWFHKTFSSLTTLEERLSKDRSSLTSESESFHEDLPIRHSPVKSLFLHLIFSSSFELEESSLDKLKSLKVAHDLLELLLPVVVSEGVLLLVVALVAILVLVGVVMLVGGVELLPLGAIGDEVSGVTALEAAHG